jgi:hypothetical protein
MDVQPTSENHVENKIENLHAMRKKDRGLVKILIVSICLVTVFGSAVYYLLLKELISIKVVQKEQYNEHLVTNQFLLSTIDWSTFRTKMTLYMRDMIVIEWKRIKNRVDLDEAYQIADAVLKECENYPYIDPFVVLAMQNVESSFRKDVVSNMGALGLNQIMPSTGRLLCGNFGWSYTDSILYDIKASTHLAVKLIDVCWAQYSNWNRVLADYNGGPYQAYYFSKNKSKLSEETAGYVPAVLAKKKAYVEGFKTYRIDNKLTSYDTLDRR